MPPANFLGRRSREAAPFAVGAQLEVPETVAVLNSKERRVRF